MKIEADRASVVPITTDHEQTKLEDGHRGLAVQVKEINRLLAAFCVLPLRRMALEADPGRVKLEKVNVGEKRLERGRQRHAELGFEGNECRRCHRARDRLPCVPVIVRWH